MDTDSSLPPLLFLAASLLLFAWASVSVAARRNETALTIFLTPPRSPAIALVYAGSAATAGVAALAVAWSVMAGAPLAASLAAAVAATVVVLSLVHQVAGLWASHFPDAARRIARPGNWFAAVAISSPDGERGTANGNRAEPSDLNGDANHGEISLTPADIMNLDHHDIHMVRSISRMDDLDVKDIMVPRLDVDAVAVSAPFPELVGILVGTRHARLPVYRDTMDDVVGIIHVSDVLRALADGQNDVALESLMREPEFVAENMAVDDLLHLMRAKSLQMVIVVDEYGGVEGIVTLEDVLEEIVGEIDDEFGEKEDDELVAVGDGSWLASATMPVAEVATAMGVELDYGDVNTIGGYVYTLLGRMPMVGDTVNAATLSIEVTQVWGRRIHQLRLVPIKTGSPSPKGAA